MSKRGVAGPAVGVANGQRGHPDVFLGEVSAVVARAVAFAQFLHVDDTSLQANCSAELHNRHVAKFVFGVNAVDRHAWANHVEERIRMLEKTETGSGVLFAEGDAFLFERGADFVEAAKLLSVEVGVLGERHHRALDLGGLAASEIANQELGVLIGHADAADAGVNADVQRYRFLQFGGDLVQRGAQRRVDHGHDAACDGVFKIVLVERAEEEDGLANAGVAQRDGFVKLHDGETEDSRLRLEELGDDAHAHAVTVVFDDGENGTGSGAAGDFLDIVTQIFAVNLYPWIKGGIFRSGGF